MKTLHFYKITFSDFEPTYRKIVRHYVLVFCLTSICFLKLINVVQFPLKSVVATDINTRSP
jgi:hypothetical protein